MRKGRHLMLTSNSWNLHICPGDGFLTWTAIDRNTKYYTEKIQGFAMQKSIGILLVFLSLAIILVAGCTSTGP